MTVRISVVLPVRNAARWLDRSISSLLNQSFGDFEVLAIDDGSTDASPGILHSHAQRDARIRILAQSGPGLVGSLNRGLAEARGVFVARMDADDLAKPTRFERQLRFFDAHPATALLGTWAQEIDDQDRELGLRKPETESCKLIAILQRANPCVHSSVMLRADAIRRVGGYRPAFEGAEDYDLWLRIADMAPIANLPEVLMCYRVHGESVSTQRAVRQAFSVRLAQCSASARQSAQSDPADGLAAPPDWHSPIAAASFYADWAKIYREIDWQRSASKGTLGTSQLVKRFAALNHVERELALDALAGQIRSGGIIRARHILTGLSTQRPRAAMQLLWRLFAG